MAKRNKLKKFADILSYDNVYENYHIKNPVIVHKDGVEVDMKGKWKSHYGNDHPLILELACGRGEYSLAMARNNPQHNYLGLDVKGARIWQGASIAIEEKLDNVAFFRVRIEAILTFFDANEVDEIWITFPDPFLKDKKVNRRLTSLNFLEKYREILKPDGILHLKTDDPTLWEFTTELWQETPFLEVIYENDDIYSKPLDFPELEHKTYYEKKHLEDGKQIRYIQAILKK